MGLFDKVAGMVGQAAGGGGVQSQLMGALQSAGISGLSGLKQQFEQSGLGAHITSWIGNGQNMPISAGQIEQALGSPAIAAIGAKLGIDTSQVAQLLSQHLPGVVDKMTPDGNVPADAGGGAAASGTGAATS
ncbi:MAG: YidB family protein [Acetobacteraceae bacterium]